MDMTLLFIVFGQLFFLLILLAPTFFWKHETSTGMAMVNGMLALALCGVFGQLMLGGVAHLIKSREQADCPSEAVVQDSVFGDHCAAPSLNAIERFIVGEFGGTFDGLAILLFGTMLIIGLALLGSALEFVNARRRGKSLHTALWSTPIFVLAGGFLYLLFAMLPS